ncbi:alpha/beta-tubulin-N-acetyltransferase 9 isoform X1 [Lepus europaeus]|uniref:alpha/beta-tubulin-N-acetyltransferase 9 isoform X1 n=1 Tax=Lepus europaeus TaxID=9983 RepID=UPI002B472309|nr:alpha/beta-tubulin-N-acetyltransferase 9 isoform X1 [Lepus europaeus]
MSLGAWVWCSKVPRVDAVGGAAAPDSLGAAEPGAGVCHAAQLAGGRRQVYLHRAGRGEVAGPARCPRGELHGGRCEPLPHGPRRPHPGGDRGHDCSHRTERWLQPPRLSGRVSGVHAGAWRLASPLLSLLEPSCRGKGLGTEAVLAMLSYGVTKLGLTKFEAKIGQGNEPSLQLFRKLHFEQVAVSSVFQEVTLRLTMNTCERQWLLEQTSHVQERPYRDKLAEPH